MPLQRDKKPFGASQVADVTLSKVLPETADFPLRHEVEASDKRSQPLPMTVMAT